ncbi:MAG: acyl-CoA dehydrogenase family protein [Alphaproteobacteria bacterium]|nr:acyl-CoA dehydrogenase family protein [Alphaproteobacteria bacterium]MCB9696560.1 acyl-CoA dehydrogenase family protein [Alphaproteobacteria bacterium]
MNADLFDPTDDHRSLRELVADFTRNEVEPQAAKHDELGVLNVELFRKIGELGLLGVTVPADDGGAGMDAVAAVIVHHELSKSDPGFCLAYLAHAMLFVNNFYHCSNEEQRARVMPKVLSGEWVAGMGMTEPGAGTDVLGMTTTAVKDGDHYVMNGTKTYITNGCEGFCFLVYAKVEGRVTSFLVDRDCPGFSTSQHIDKLGMRGSTMSELIFDDCRVPAANLLGDEGQGITHMMRNLELERLTLAAMSVGIADRCVDIMVRHAQERKTFGKPLLEYGQIQRYIADSYAATEAAKSLVYNVARSVGPEHRNRIGTDAAKLFAAPVGKQVADAAMQVMGGAGYCREYPVERLWRDAKLLEIGGGTLEAHQKNLARDLARARPL